MNHLQHHTVRPILAVSLLLSILIPASTTDADAGIASDAFAQGELDTSLWTFIDPLNDAAVEFDGACTAGSTLNIVVPGGTSHNIWTTGNDAPRIMQNAADDDFEVEVKFASPLSGAYQMQGLIVEQNPQNFLRFEFHSDEDSLRVFAATFANGSAKVKVNQSIPDASPMYMRVKRTGNSWTYSWSDDGDMWHTAATFNHAASVQSVGIHAGNANNGSSPAPAHAAIVEYFSNTASPPVYDPLLLELEVEVVGAGEVSIQPDLPAYECGSEVTLTATADPEHTFAGWSGDANSDNHSIVLVMYDNQSVTATFVEDDDPGDPGDPGDPDDGPSGIVSDGFDGHELNASVWSFIDPLGDATASVTGACEGSGQLLIDVPGGTSHNIWTDAHNGPRIMQQAENTDFELEVKFDSMLEEQFQMQGLTIQQSQGTFLRLEFYASNAGVHLMAAAISNGIAKVFANHVIGDESPGWMRVLRVDNQWLLSWSMDGQAWTPGAFFVQPLLVTSVGIHGGNHSRTVPPPHLVEVDYFSNTALPPLPAEPGGPLTLVVESDGNGSVQIDPEQTEYQCGDEVTLTAIANDDYVFDSWTGTLSGDTNPATLTLAGDAFVMAQFIPSDSTGGGPNDGPAIDVWYGDNQSFGQNGEPQTWVNVLGNIPDYQDLDSLHFHLNGGSPQSLSIGPDTRRLQAPGDFNVEIPYADLQPGENSIVIVAKGFDGKTTGREVTVTYHEGNVWPLPYSIDWSQETNILDVSQVVDGEWALEGDNVRSVGMGYDRLLAIGDLSWTDYEVTVPITYHAIDPSGYVWPSNQPAFGFGMRWSGHLDWGGWQPTIGYTGLGALGLHMFRLSGCGERLELYVHPFSFAGNAQCQVLEPDVAYMWKMRVRTVPQGQEYNLRVWEQGTPEPDEWSITTLHTNPKAPLEGSLLLLAHHVDASFGEVTIIPLDADE